LKNVLKREIQETNLGGQKKQLALSMFYFKYITPFCVLKEVPNQPIKN